MRILLASSIDPAAVGALERDHDVVCRFGAAPEQLREAVHDCEVLVFRSGVQISAEVLDRASELRLLVRAGSGLDNIDVETATRRGMEVVRVPGSSAQPVAELTFALLLSLVRKVSLADKLLREGRWPKAELGGPLLSGKTLGIVGAGRIGTRVGEMASAWGMRVLGCVANPTMHDEADMRGRGITLTDLDSVLSVSDFVSLHVPLDDATRHMIGASAFARMKKGSYLVNLARGGVVDETALLTELISGERLLGAAMDVHEREGEGVHSPLAALPNVVLTPHIGAMALDSQRLIGERVIELIDAYRRGEMQGLLQPDEIVNQYAIMDGVDA